MTRAEFLAERRTGIGGSDVHNLFDLEPYGCARRLAYDKLDVPQDYPVDESGPIRRGQKLEPIIAEEYAIKTGRYLATEKMRRHPEHQWATVNTDRVVSDTVNGPYYRALELKSLGRGMFAKVKREGLPDAYILQLQHGMFVTKREAGAFAIHEPEAWQLCDWDVDRDNDLIKEIEKEGGRFWNALQAGEMPDRLDPKAPQCQSCPWRTTCQGEALLSAVKASGEVAFDAALSALVQEFAEMRQIHGEAEDLLDSVKERLAAAIGSRDAIDVPGYRVYYRTQTAERLNEVKVKTLLDLYNTLIRRMEPKVDYDGALTWIPLLDWQRKFIHDLKTPSVSRPLRIFAK